MSHYSVCKFFLENRCRYGENCRFEHPIAVVGGGGAQRSLFGGGGGGNSWRGGGGNQKVQFRDSFGTATGNQDGNNQFKWVSNQNNYNNPQSNAQSAIDLVNALPKEMEMWEKTKMWPFSCLSVEKDAPSLPDFVDTSVDELRNEFYEAQKTGNIAAYNQRLQSLVMEFQNKRMQLKHMNMDMKQKLVAFIEQARKNKGNHSTPSSSVFGQGSNNQTSGIFGQSSSGGSVFGKPGSFGSSPTTGQTSSLFGKPQSSGGLFSSNPSTQGQSSLFGGQSQSQSTGGSGLFGGGQTSQQTSNIFGGSSSSAQTGLFGKPAAGSSGSVFGNAGASAPTGLFGSSAGSTPGLFGQASSSPATAPSGLFGASPGQLQAQSGPFGSATPGSGLLPTPEAPTTPGGGLLPTPGRALLPTPSSNTSTGLFGKAVQPTPGLFGKAPSFSSGPSGTGLFGKGPAIGGGSTGTGLFGKEPSPSDAVVSGNIDSDPKGLYSLMEDLTEQDIEAFKAPSFTLGKLPIKPPPKELVMI